MKTFLGQYLKKVTECTRNHNKMLNWYSIVPTLQWLNTALSIHPPISSPPLRSRWWFHSPPEVNWPTLLFKDLKLNREVCIGNFKKYVSACAPYICFQLSLE